MLGSNYFCSRCKGEFPFCGCCKSHPSNMSTHIQPKPNLDNYDDLQEEIRNMTIDIKQVEEVEFDGIDTSDHPDYCDAYPCDATYKGRPMTDYELDALMEQYPAWLNEKLQDWLISYLY